ncbi:SIS domain-containing protein [Methanoculleus sp. YWC-01]|jgi:6-phospho-3-hexuloisomerase|uniref:SIS domain-containing protein n=1 Tax=Methanoculleus nereidis TaxID=2735141 RepID=A0ABU3Z474_9EURY|nr:6-phospho-3-hexuloisomerase [Methanoculleus sp. YWC-01]MCK9298816.1 SIS domain-containing protein [Methanoculleus sp.]MDV4343434.1 SIS domain-containing protein [Methanoculleus sp. YWC-01]PKL55969.1 MAG: 6-phospho-3-hexuloisomerase [Methanomicrobiales archaeon HGW-Methanomicrobiales-6]
MQQDCPSIADLMLLMTSRLEETARTMDLESAGQFLDVILSAKRIYLAGAGRSGLVARAFAQRLMHLGFESYVIGETITPAFGPEDVLVAFSGSGETQSVVDACETAREIGGKICLVTSTPDSHIGRMADCIVEIGNNRLKDTNIPRDFEIRQLTGQYRSISGSFAPLGTLFETAALVFSDAVVSALMEVRHCTPEELRSRLANVQ